MEQFLDWDLSSALDHDYKEQLEVWVLDEVVHSIVQTNDELNLLPDLFVLRISTSQNVALTRGVQCFELLEQVAEMCHVCAIFVEPP